MNMRKAVPAVIIRMSKIVTGKLAVKKPLCRNRVMNPAACKTARAIARYLVHFWILRWPHSPSFCKASREGIAITRSWKIMDALM